MCQTHIITAEFDPLRDEGEALYRKLVAAGVDARACRFQGVIHGFFQLADISSARASVWHNWRPFCVETVKKRHDKRLGCDSVASAG